MNTTLSDIATALTGSLAADGQTPVTANLPMSGYILTGLGAGSGAGHSIRYEQLFTSGTVSLLGVLSVQDGTVGAPGVRFASSSTTGIYSSSDNTVRFAIAGAEGARVIAGGVYVTGGGVAFPATQVASADPNTLDDYEEGTWTPVLTFATPGNVVIVLSTAVGVYRKIGSQVFVTCDAVTSTFTHTTASGNFQITGLPFTSANTSGQTHHGACSIQGVTKAGYTSFTAALAANSSAAILVANGSGQNESAVTASDMPTGGSVIVRFSLAYNV